jgi:hypothetical protein
MIPTTRTTAAEPRKLREQQCILGDRLERYPAIPVAGQRPAGLGEFAVGQAILKRRAPLHQARLFDTFEHALPEQLYEQRAQVERTVTRGIVLQTVVYERCKRRCVIDIEHLASVRL